MPSFSSVILTTSLASLALARTDLSGCTSSTAIVDGGASLLYYVPGTGEICAFLDCGGGRAPPKTTVPGCAAYSGTATYSPSYIPGYGSMSMASSTASPAATSYTSSSTPAITSSASSSSSSSSSSAAAASSSSGVTTITTTTSKASNVSSASSVVAPVGGASSSSSAAKPMGTGVGSGSAGGVNGTISTGSPSASGPGVASSTGGAAKLGGAGLLLLGGLVAAL